MNTFATNLVRRCLPAVVDRAPVRLVRRFVETGDERCPLAGIWMTLSDAVPSTTDDPDISLPAWRRLLRLWAVHLPLTALC